MLNEKQLKMVDDVKSGKTSAIDALNMFHRFEQKHYEQTSLREFLFALDGTLKLAGSEWTEIFVNRLVQWGGYVTDGVMSPKSTTEIGQFLDDYHMSEDTLALAVYLIESSTKRPNNALSFVRRCFREFYAGIQPVTDERLLVVERFMRYRTFEPGDYSLYWHLIDETKGLPNVARFPTTMSIMVADRCHGLSPQDKKRFIFDPLESVEEVCPTVLKILETLKSGGEALPSSLLQHTDQTLEWLSGSTV